MEGGIALHGRQREKLLECYRRHPDPQVRHRAHIVLLLSQGYTWALIAAVLFCSSKTIALWSKRFEAGGVEALLGQERGRPAVLLERWAAVSVGWVRHCWPSDFGLRRSRWCCRTIVLLLLELHQARVSEESVRRWLHAGNLVWRRPRPVIGPKDPKREERLAEIRLLLAWLPPDQVAFFEDEVDVNTNPKIGAMWMERGDQAQVVTPGNNTKRYLAGSLDWRTGTLIKTLGKEKQGRNTDLLLAHLDDLRRHYRRYSVIHVILDNAKPHTAKRLTRYLEAWHGRIVLHYLPKYSPEANPIERVWWKLHEEITRNHRCPDMASLLDQVMGWLGENGPFGVEDQVYFPDDKSRKAALSPLRGAI